MTVADVLKAMSTASTVTSGHVASYEVRHGDIVVGFVEAQVKEWKLIWTVHSPAKGGEVTSKSGINIQRLLAEFGEVDLTPSQETDAERFFRVHLPG